MESSSVVGRAVALADGARLGLDTAPVIYFVEAHPRYDALVTPVFQSIASGQWTGVTSVITLTEVLTKPVRMGQTTLQLQYRYLLTASEHLELVPIDAAVAERAAVLRAQYDLRTPDALQVAAVQLAGCQAFLTNDSSLKRVTEIRVITMDDLV